MIKTTDYTRSLIRAMLSFTSLALSAKSCYGLALAVSNGFLKLIVAFMYLLPIGFEIFSEQSRILAKIQMQMATDSMMGPGADMQPTIRPF
jgi:hypothetical protein